MDIKWISTRNKAARFARPTEKGAKGQGIKAVCGFLAFFLGISLLFENGLFFASNLSSADRRQWCKDSFQEDYRDTQRFRDYVSNTLETLITMGAGGKIYNNYYDDGQYHSWWTEEVQASSIHAQMKEDKNLLYTVSAKNKELYTNDTSLGGGTTTSTLPNGYSFLLQFDGTRLRIWQDNEELDIYGDGYYYYEDNNQWYVPGYKNFVVDEKAHEVQVTIAVIDKPQIFMKGNYSGEGTEQYNQLYYLQRNLQTDRQIYLSRCIRLGIGVALIALYLLLRRDKKRADQSLARITGTVWFELKVIAALLLLLCLLPRSGYLSEIWNELGHIYANQPTSSSVIIESGLSNAVIAAELGGAAYNAMDILVGNGDWLLQDYLNTLAEHPISLLLLLWGFYLLLFNDWRYNKKPWRHGILGLLFTRELTYPVQKRLSRMSGMIVLASGALLLIAGYLFTLVASNLSAGPLWWILTAICGVALVLLAWTLKRQQSIWIDLGMLCDQVAHLRSGQIDKPLELPFNHELYQAADDLNHVQQGLHQAVEERTRSERMKVELVTNVSHDLKTPLTSIISYTELLAQEPLEPPASEYVQILNDKSQRLKAMVQDVFEVSKATSGQLPVKLETLDFGRLLRQTLADMAQAIEGSGLTLRTAIPEEAVPITADSDRMYRVFQNLIGNALKYSLSGTRIYLTLAVEGDVATASVKNTSITELNPGADYTGRFVRGDGSRTDGGSGLGLSIADSFTRACGGELKVTTEADLFTACVTFSLSK